MELDKDLELIDQKKIQRLWELYQYTQKGAYKDFSDYVRQNINN